MQLRKPGIMQSQVAFLANMLIAYLAYAICRVAYYLENMAELSLGIDALDKWEVLKGCLMFDTSAILYTNALYALVMLLPLHYKERRHWQSAAKWVFVTVNALSVVVNLCDAVYFRYTGRRTTATIFSEFGAEGNIGEIVGVELLSHWYLVLLAVALVAAMALLYVKPAERLTLQGRKAWIGYYVIQVVSLAVFVPLCIGGMRGGITKAVRPITISNANQYVNRPSEAALVLNTPFSMIRTIGKAAFVDPKFFAPEQLDAIYSPVFQPETDKPMNRKNVVVLIVESLGREYVGALNDSTCTSYTPFLDRLIARSVTFDHSFSNGRKSIDGMPSILSSIPRFGEPFFLTPASMNKVSGIAGELRRCGYNTAFFHGAENGSMGFEAFARATGYEHYFGRTEYCADPATDGDADYDGMWAIWDEEFLQFYARKMNEMQQPFVTTVFTASSHHPYRVPEKYAKRFADEPGDDNVMHKCIRYADYSLERFFDTAARMPWYENTIFVLTGDHTNISSRVEYQSSLGVFGVPIVIFDPTGDIAPERRHCVAQQIDIMPTVLRYLGYDKCFVAFGQDLFGTADADTWAVNHNSGIYQYVKGNYVLQMTDDGKVKGVYDYVTDPEMQHNKQGSGECDEAAMEQQLKAIVQSYMVRMTTDRLVAE